MFDIAKIDKNFAVSGKITKDGLDIYDVSSFDEFRVYGLIGDGEYRYVRIPKSIAEKTNPGVLSLYRNTAGGRLRFRTNSKRIYLHAYMEEIGNMTHFARCGSSGFDMYFADEETPLRYNSTFVPNTLAGGYESEHSFEDSREREILIHFPTYSSVERLEIGLDSGASLSAAPEYSLPVPVVYYGSSITQGGCCSRPGNVYENTISRRLDCDHVNLGFSGSALGEQIIADYTASLDMSAFVLDYDHNAPTPEHLEATHHNFYKTVRAKHPDIPMIFVTRPQAYPNAEEILRRDIVKRSYELAVAEGDTNVSFIDGIEMMREGGGEEGLVDGCHPTDLGFSVMAKRIGDELAKVLELK